MSSDWVTSHLGVLQEPCAICGGSVETFKQERYVNKHGEFIEHRVARYLATCRGCSLLCQPCTDRADLEKHWIAASVTAQLTGSTRESKRLQLWRAYGGSTQTFFEGSTQTFFELFEELREA